MDSDNNDFEFIGNNKCNFDQDIDSSDNAALNDEYDLKKEIREISELKKYLTQQTIEHKTLIETLQNERDEYKKLNNNLQTELAQISQLKLTLQNDHQKFNEMLEKFNKQSAEKKENIDYSAWGNCETFNEPFYNSNNNKDMVSSFDFAFNTPIKNQNNCAQMLDTKTAAKKETIYEQKDNVFDENDPNMLQQLPQWVQGCFENKLSSQYESCTNIRKILSVSCNPPIQQVIDSGVVPRLIQFIRAHDSSKDQLQMEAAWALTNICSGTAEQTACIIRNGAIPMFIEAIKSNAVTMEVKEQLIWALGNIAGDSKECRDLVIQCDVLNKFLCMCKTCENISFVRNMSWVLINFCRPKPIPKWDVINIVIECYNHLIDNICDDEVYSNYIWAFYYLTNDINSNENNYGNLLLNYMVQSGVIQMAIDLLDHSDKAIRKAALRVIGNIVASKDDKHTEIVLKYNLVSKLQKKLLSNETDGTKEDSLWILSNITAGTNEQLEVVIKANVFPVIINILNGSDKYRITKESVWTVANAINCANETQIDYLVNVGAITTVLSCLKRFYESKKMNKKYETLVLVILECIEGLVAMDNNNDYIELIEECDGINTLKLIESSNSNENISNKVNELLNKMNTESEEMVEENTISNKVLLSDDMILKSSIVSAWRYDYEQQRWRKRGRGHLMVYKNNTYKYNKIIFKDIKHNNKMRLLQQIKFSMSVECSVSESGMNDEMYVEWNAHDYSIDLSEPLISRWRLKFNDEPEKAQQFVDIFNNGVRSINQIISQ